MAEDLVQWASPTGVGDVPGGDLLRLGQSPPGTPIIDPRTKPVRRRPNNGRKKRTDRHPLAEPPWEMLRALNIPLPPLLENLPYTPTNWRRGYPYLAWQRGVIEMWGTVCHLCGHEGAYSADHLIPLSVWSNQPYEPMLSRPAHGVKQPDGGEGCPTCHVKCNSSRGNRALAIEIANYTPAITL